MGRSADVFVIGGGPAGLAAAIAASAKGFRVTLADGMEPPIDKACGEGLMPDSIAALDRLGVLIRAEDGMAFRGIRFLEGRTQIDGDFPEGPGLGMRRTVLHRKMAERASECGVEFLWNTPVTGLHADGVLAGGNLIPAKWVIGADGSRSRVRRWSGLDAKTKRNCRVAYRRHYRIKPWSEYTEVHWGKDTQAYATAVSSEEICVTVISSRTGGRLETMLPEFPTLWRNLEGAATTTTERGAMTSMHRLAEVCRGRVALIGDASGSVDAITGEGLGLAFQQAEALAESLAMNDLEQYQGAHRRLARRPHWMARLMLIIGNHPVQREKVLRVLLREPRLFERLLAVHVGHSSPLRVAATGALFGWRLLAA
jgi:flavin-dependent dehydrogenase